MGPDIALLFVQFVHTGPRDMQSSTCTLVSQAFGQS